MSSRSSSSSLGSAPFTLAVLEPGRAPALHRRDGTQMETRSVTAPGLLLTSSGAGLRVEEIRRAKYARLAPGSPPRAEEIEALQRSHLDSLGADSFCMHGEEAETASLARMDVGPNAVWMTYVPGPPCRTEPLAPFDLARAGLNVPRYPR